MTAVRVLLVSKFLHHVGGVETYFRWQTNALQAVGVEVAVFGMTPPPGEQLMSPPEIPAFLTPERSFDAGDPKRGRSAAAAIYSPAVGRRLREALRVFRPDVIHFHGTCFQLTPSVFHQAQRSGARIFLTAHEYKLVCANQLLFDDRRKEVCTDCVGLSAAGKSARILRRRCIKASAGPSLIGAIEMPISTAMWRGCGGRVLAPSRFMADILTEDGRCGEVEHLELPWPEPKIATRETRNSVLFMARLSPEKGIRTAVEAWARVAPRMPDSRLRIAGRGSEEEWVSRYLVDHSVERVDLLGMLDGQGIETELRHALLTVHPSTVHDNSPFSVRESLCAGVPAAVTSLGGGGELVGGDRGPVLEPGDLDGWGEAMLQSARTRIAGTERFRVALMERWRGEEAHLDRLLQLYAD